jgi:phage/plasmid-like protein (TIGR03299 family)
MAHDIATIDGKPAMAYFGKAPWHGLGAVLKSQKTTAAEVIKAANLDWEVEKKPVFAVEGDKFCAVRGCFATVRATAWGKPDCELFGLVGEHYQVLQNRDSFSFFDPVIETGQVTYETAGALAKGARVWVLAKLKDNIRITKEDEVERYLLLSNGHDGRTAVRIKFTPVRVVCQNTLSFALAHGRDLMSSHHGRGMQQRLQIAQEAVGRILAQYDSLAQHYRRFAKVQMPAERLSHYLGEVFPTPKRRANQSNQSYELALGRTNKMRTNSAVLFESGRGNDLPGIKGTLWAAYNGVTELVDHHLTYNNSDQRMEAICFGEGEDTKHRALDAALMLSRN